MKLVHFGAGNIGRGAIPQIFDGIYESICFIDPNVEIVNKLNKIKTYSIINENSCLVKNYKAILLTDINNIIDEILDADIISTSCGFDNLNEIANIINKINKLEKKPIIICFENNYRPTTYLKEKIDNKSWFNFIDCTIDRVIPKQEMINTLDIRTETYLSVVVEINNNINLDYFKNCKIVDNLENYISLKLYCVNGLHFVISVLGYNKQITYIHQALNDSKIMQNIDLYNKYLIDYMVQNFKFNKNYIFSYLYENLNRFKNEDLLDECIRISRNFKLKIKNDNRIAPIFIWYFSNINDSNYEKMKELLFNILSYKNPSDDSSIEINNSINEIGMQKTIEKYMGIKLN